MNTGNTLLSPQIENKKEKLADPHIEEKKGKQQKVKKVKKGIPQPTEQEIKQQRKERAQKTLEWLIMTFPRCLSLQTPQPLKIGIREDILEAMKALQPSQDIPSRKSIPLAMTLYTTSLAYYKAILNHSRRINLQGEEEGEVTDKQKGLAQRQILLKDQKARETDHLNAILPSK